ncbi:MAG: class I SAM-dependent rRNA methyltransferase [Planctomycetota bacterium]|nr:MAG: class I SAM-dependent rRNA methyltransferase [Planctomycetota bacterium]
MINSHPVCTVKRRKVANVFAGEPWIYPNAVVSTDAEHGLMQVVTEDQQCIGYADINTQAPIRARLLWRGTDWPGDEAFIEERLLAAIERRLRLGYTFQACGIRVVNGEGDDCSGLVVDAFGTSLVIDVYSRGMRDRLPVIEAFFRERLPHMHIYTRCGEDAARREGIDPIDPVEGTAVFCEQAVRYEITFGAGQKTGFYLDQRDNRRLVAQWARGRTVLDLFSYHGAFALSALANGAESALAVDSSSKALEVAMANATANGLELETCCGDVFDIFDDLVSLGPFDMVICDPPKLAPGKRDRNKALKAYRHLIDRSLKATDDQGLLLVASCSHAIDHEDLRTILKQQAKSQGCLLDVIAITGHPSDHPWPVGFTTGRYLSAIIVEKRGT